MADSELSRLAPWNVLAVPIVYYVGAALFCPFVGLLSAYNL